MYLTNIRIEGFRGILRLDLRLGATTVLVGENDWGKASLQAVLDRCLGPAAQNPPQFKDDDLHVGAKKRANRIRIILSIRENNAKEFDAEPLHVLRAEQASGTAQVRRTCTLVLVAEPDSKGQLTTSIHVKDNAEKDGIEALAQVQRRCPVLLVRPDQGVNGLASVASNDQGPHKQKIEHEIESVYDRLVSTNVGIQPAELEEAIADIGVLLHEHALRVLERRPEAGELLQQLGGVPNELALHGGPALPLGQHSSQSRAISLLILVGALLHARGPRALDPDAMPIVFIEEPEAHLHPTLLAGIWRLIQGMDVQRIVSTYSGILLADVPLHMMRRITRSPEGAVVHRVRRKSLNADERRRIGYHIRALRGRVLFARAWIFIEGETEFWLLPELARIVGYDLDAEGVQCIEFAQCGLEPLFKLANDLGIQWYLMTDGDNAGSQYVAQARGRLDGDELACRVLQLKEHDIERHLWEHGLASVYRIAAGRGPAKRKNEQPKQVIDAAIHAHSKPALALRIIERAEQMERDELSPILRAFIESVVKGDSCSTAR